MNTDKLDEPSKLVGILLTLQYETTHEHNGVEALDKAKADIQELITAEVVKELESLFIGKPFVGPNGEKADLNVPDYTAIWNRIVERHKELKASLDGEG